jgi:hypothetical protein
MKPARLTLMVVACRRLPALARIRRTRNADEFDRTRGGTRSSTAPDGQRAALHHRGAEGIGRWRPDPPAAAAGGNTSSCCPAAAAPAAAPKTGAGFDGADAVPFKGTYFSPGVYRVTRSGGAGGSPHQRRAGRARRRWRPDGSVRGLLRPDHRRIPARRVLGWSLRPGLPGRVCRPDSRFPGYRQHDPGSEGWGSRWRWP